MYLDSELLALSLYIKENDTTCPYPRSLFTSKLLHVHCCCAHYLLLLSFTTTVIECACCFSLKPFIPKLGCMCTCYYMKCTTKRLQGNGLSFAGCVLCSVTNACLTCLMLHRQSHYTIRSLQFLFY